MDSRGATKVVYRAPDHPRSGLAGGDGAYSSSRGSGYAGVLVVVAFALLVLGLVMVGSASGSLDGSLFSKPFWQTMFGRQVIFAGIGVVLMAALARWGQPLLRDPRYVRIWPVLALIGVVITLIITFIPQLATESRGAQRWIQIAPGVGFQPSEFAKLAMVAMLAWVFSREWLDAKSFVKGFVPAAVLVGLFVLLVGVEDFGSAALFAVVGLGVMFAAGCRWYYLVGAAVGGGGAMYALLLAKPYRMERIKAFLDPMADPLGTGYHPLQSLMTIASGGWWGVGLGNGVQKRGYLPECTTDFIFSVICEEMGVLGGIMVLGLFTVLLWLGLRAMYHVGSTFAQLFIFGMTITIVFQAAMNVAVATVCAPTTGISLPLISAGGSGIVVFCCSIGLMAASLGTQSVGDSLHAVGEGMD